MAPLLVLALMLSAPEAGAAQEDSILKVSIKNCSVTDPLKKDKTSVNDISSDSLRIIRQHHLLGYFNARVKVKRDQKKVEYDVDPGHRAFVKEFMFKGNEAFGEDWLIGYMPKKASAFFSHQDILQNIDRIVELYANSGLPFAQVSIGDSTAGEDTLILFYTVKEGPVVFLTGLVTGGNEVTKDFVITKIFGLERGSLFSRRMISKKKKRLMKSALFSRIYETILEKENSYYLKLRLEEQRLDYVEALINYQPEPSDLSFDANINFFNLLGTARTFIFSYDSKGRDFALGYGEPWLIFPTLVKLSLVQETYDLGRKIRGEIRMSRDLVEDLGLGISWGIEDFKGSKTQFVGLAAFLDKDDFLETLGVELGFYDSRRKTRFKFDGEERIGPFRLANHYAQLFDRSVKDYDLFRVGGAKTIRGYWEDEFKAQSLIWLNCEFKELPVYPFFDCLFILDHGLLNYEDHYGYGLGLEAKSRWANGSIDFGFPLGRSWRNGKVHIRIERRF